MEAIRLERTALVPAPVNRARLARYLELPSVAQIDAITDMEIRTLDARRAELLSSWHGAAVVPIARVDGRRIALKADSPAIQATDRFGHSLRERGADSLVVAAFTLGGRVDQIIQSHLDRQEVYEAFVLKQWAATLAEQARVELNRALRDWADDRRRSLMPYDGPGYNGWPLTALNPLLEIVYDAHEPDVARPIRATEAGVLLPTNSMVIVFGVTSQRRSTFADDERVAQCHRCAMRNCRFRMVGAIA
jgi:hypothetical protein